MDKNDRPATLGSLKKWERIIEGLGADRGPDNCPLCRRYWHKDCEGCPVSQKSGFSSCYETPYDSWTDAQREERQELGLTKAFPHEEAFVIGPKTMAAAIAEHAFLESLLKD